MNLFDTRRMVFLGALALALASLAGCASSKCFPEEARVVSRADGIPRTDWPQNETLIDREVRERYCQVLFEPAFAEHHVVWLTILPSGEGRVHVAVRDRKPPNTFDRGLDWRVTALLEHVCRAFLIATPHECQRIVRDGVRYYVAQYDGGGYAMRSFASPGRGTLDRKFVRLAEALRDYAVAPSALSSANFWRLLEVAQELECELEPSRERCA